MLPSILTFRVNVFLNTLAKPEFRSELYCLEHGIHPHSQMPSGKIICDTFVSETVADTSFISNLVPRAFSLTSGRTPRERGWFISTSELSRNPKASKKGQTGKESSH